MNTIDWSRKAAKQLRSIPKADARRIVSRVDTLELFPNVTGLNVKALENHENGYRLRVGNYRVLFDFDDEIQVIAIEEVKKRDERTY